MPCVVSGRLCRIHIDLAELRGYHYHTGVVFAAYTPGQGQAVAQGGRYDEIGQVFGRARPATGFSTDLATLLRLGASVATPLHWDLRASGWGLRWHNFCMCSSLARSGRTGHSGVARCYDCAGCAGL